MADGAVQLLGEAGVGVGGELIHEVAQLPAARLAEEREDAAVAGGALVDDITYSPPDPPSVFAHPMCLNTYRNGVFLGNEAPAAYPHAP